MKTAAEFFHSKEQWGNTSDEYNEFSTLDMIKFAEEYASQQPTAKKVVTCDGPHCQECNFMCPNQK